jgi:hypothetical protein
MTAAPLSPPSLRAAIGIAARDRVLYLIAAVFVALSLARNFAQIFATVARSCV